MNRIFPILTVAVAVLLTTVSNHAQTRRPAPAQKKPVIAVSPPAETKVKPVELSPAQQFYNEGLKCDAKDFDCQISNFTKAINLNLAIRDVFLKRGDAYLARGDFEKAVADLTKVIESDLNDAGAYKRRAKAFLAMPKTRAAVQAAVGDLSSAIDLDPKDVEAYRLRSSAYSTLGMTDKANSDLDKSLVLDPGNAAAYLDRGLQYFRSKDFEKAVESYTRFVQLRPNDADGYEARGFAHLRGGNFAAAITDLEKAVAIDQKRTVLLARIGDSFVKTKKFDEAIALYERTIASNPKLATGYYKRASVNSARGNYAATIADLDKSIELDASSAPSYTLRCSSHYVLGDFEKALADCLKATTLSPDFDAAFTYRGLALYAVTGDVEIYKADLDRGQSLAINAANKLLAQNPNDVDALIQRATAYQGKQRYVESIADFTTAIRIDPENAAAYRGRGASYTGQQNWQAAANDYAKAIEVDPADEYSYLLLGSTYPVINPNAPLSQSGKYEIDMYTRGLQANPGSSMLYNMRASTRRFKFDDNKGALADYSTALDLATKSGNAAAVVSAYDSLAQVSFKMKDLATALAYLGKAIEKYPNYSSAYYNRAWFYESSLKDMPNAASDYLSSAQAEGGFQKLSLDRATKIDPARASAARARLEEKKRRVLEQLNAISTAPSVSTAAAASQTASPAAYSSPFDVALSDRQPANSVGSSTGDTATSTTSNSNRSGGNSASGSASPGIVVPRNLGVPYPNPVTQMEREVNKFVAIADMAKTCEDGWAAATQIQYIVNNGGSVPLALAKTHVEKARDAIAEMVKILGCK